MIASVPTSVSGRSQVRSTVQGQQCGALRTASRQSHIALRPSCPRTQAASLQITRSSNRDNGDSNFVAGFLVGGALMGTLGFLFAPQISKVLLGDDARLRLPRFMEDELPKDPEQTKQDLIERIAQLNASIDEVASQLKVKEEVVVMAGKGGDDGMKIM